MKTSADGAGGKASFNSKKFCLCIGLGFGYLEALSLSSRNNIVIAPKPMYVSKNPRVFEVDQRCIHHKARKVGRVKEVEVSIFNSSTVKVGGGVGFRL